MTSYRYPKESLILALTILLVLVVIAVTAAATLCGSLLFVLVMLAISFFMNRSHHADLIASAKEVTMESAPGLFELAHGCARRLQAPVTRLFVAPGRSLNAYTFGLVEPPDVVVYAPLLHLMDEDELRFIIGHEMGHVSLGHTRLNSLIGGMAGIPSPYMAAVVLNFSFRWWNRACEYSADRAGLLACGRPDKAASALIKITGGASAVRSEEAWQQILREIDAEDDGLAGNLTELLSTHPLIVRRLEALREFARSEEYMRLSTDFEVDKRTETEAGEEEF